VTPHAPELRILVVDVASERAGTPDSTWIRADREPAHVEAEIDDWLAQSPFDVSEGIAVRGYEGFGDAVFTGTESLEEIARLALLIRRHGLIVVEALKRLHGGEARQVGEVERLFAEDYMGPFAKLDDLARAFADRMDLECSELLDPYVDWTAFARDAEGEHFISITDADGRIHAFTP
jgi:hypothetical protein